MTASVPARTVLLEADAAYRHSGHENLGFLSETHGFLPRRPPQLSLPPAFAAWDEAAASLPDLIRTRSVRKALDGLPPLPAGDLPDASLIRASTIWECQLDLAPL